MGRQLVESTSESQIVKTEASDAENVKQKKEKKKKGRDEGKRGGNCLFPNSFKESIVDDKDLGEDNKTVFEDKKQNEAITATITNKKKLFKTAKGRRRKQSK